MQTHGSVQSDWQKGDVVSAESLTQTIASIEGDYYVGQNSIVDGLSDLYALCGSPSPVESQALTIIVDYPSKALATIDLSNLHSFFSTVNSKNSVTVVLYCRQVAALVGSLPTYVQLIVRGRVSLGTALADLYLMTGSSLCVGWASAVHVSKASTAVLQVDYTLADGVKKAGNQQNSVYAAGEGISISSGVVSSTKAYSPGSGVSISEDLVIGAPGLGYYGAGAVPDTASTEAASSLESLYYTTVQEACQAALSSASDGSILQGEPLDTLVKRLSGSMTKTGLCTATYYRPGEVVPAGVRYAQYHYVQGATSSSVIRPNLGSIWISQLGSMGVLSMAVQLWGNPFLVTDTSTLAHTLRGGITLLPDLCGLFFILGRCSGDFQGQTSLAVPNASVSEYVGAFPVALTNPQDSTDVGVYAAVQILGTTSFATLDGANAVYSTSFAYQGSLTASGGVACL